MLIYNITLKTDWAIQPQWLAWMKETYINVIMESRCFTKHQLVRLLEIEEDEGPTYALQLYAVNREKYSWYIENFLPENEALVYETWKGNVLFFSTLMEVVD